MTLLGSFLAKWSTTGFLSDASIRRTTHVDAVLLDDHTQLGDDHFLPPQN